MDGHFSHYEERVDGGQRYLIQLANVTSDVCQGWV